MLPSTSKEILCPRFRMVPPQVSYPICSHFIFTVGEFKCTMAIMQEKQENHLFEIEWTIFRSLSDGQQPRLIQMCSAERHHYAVAGLQPVIRYKLELSVKVTISNSDSISCQSLFGCHQFILVFLQPEPLGALRHRTLASEGLSVITSRQELAPLITDQTLSLLTPGLLLKTHYFNKPPPPLYF